MEREFLEDCLAKGMSMHAIGREIGKDQSTVGYWVKSMVSRQSAPRSIARRAL
jgi:transposase-like protein